MRRLSRIVALSVFVATAGVLAWLYYYGEPIGYQVTATTISGEQIILGPDVAEVHLAYTQPYAFANQWRMFLDAVRNILVTNSTLLQAVVAAGGIGTMGYKMVRRLLIGSANSSRDSPPRSPPFWPYKFW